MLLLHHYSSVHVQIDLGWVEMQACREKDFTTELTSVDQIVNVVALKLIHAIQSVEKAEDVEDNRCDISFTLAKVIDCGSLDACSKGMFEAKNRASEQKKVEHFLNHDSVVHLETEIQDVIRIGSRIVNLLSEVALVVGVNCMELSQTQGCNQLLLRLTGHGSAHYWPRFSFIYR